MALRADGRTFHTPPTRLLVSNIRSILGSALQPDESPNFLETWWALQEALKTGSIRHNPWSHHDTDRLLSILQGKTKAIGVSNLSEKHLASLLDHPRSTIVPAVNQVEAHPCLPQHKLLEFCRSRGILLVAYSPVGKHKFANDQDLQAISKRLNVTTAQVILSWAVQRGTAVVPKSEHEARLAENISVS
jgi:glycerol 2-dehydrogenase (NADP+)